MISGDGALTKRGEGALQLTAGNGYAGGTRIAAGTVIIDSDANLGAAGGALTLDGGTLRNTASLVSARTVGIDSGAGGGTFDTDAGTILSLDGAISGAGRLFKRGEGTLALGGTNSFSGATLIGGTVEVSADENLGKTSDVLNLGGGRLSTLASFSSNRKVDVKAGGGGIDTAAGTTLTLDGNLKGGGVLTKTGDGTLVLTADNAGGIFLSQRFTGTLVVDAGTVRISNNDNLGSAGGTSSPDTARLKLDGGTLEVTATTQLRRIIELGESDGTIRTVGNDAKPAAFDIRGPGALIKDGAGTLRLQNDNAYAGGTFINAGTLQIEAGNNLGANGTPVAFNGGSLQATGTATINGAVTLNAAEGKLNVDGSKTLTLNGPVGGTGNLVKTGAGTLALAAANAYSGDTDMRAGRVRASADDQLGAAGSVLKFTGGALQTTESFVTQRDTLADGNDATLITNGDTTLTHDGVISGTGGLQKSGAGTLVLGGVNTYTGETLIAEGTLDVAADASLGAAGATLRLGGGTLRSSASFATTRQTALDSGANTFATAGGTTLDHDGVITGAGALIKAGAGSLVLSGNNTYTGGTRIDGGVLEVSRNNNLGNAAGTLQLDAGTLHAGESFSTGRATTLQSGGGTIDLDTGAVLTHTGSITGTGTLTLTGDGTLHLRGNNAYTGDTLLAGGTLRIGAGTALGSGTVDFTTGRLRTSASVTHAGALVLRDTAGEIDTDGGTTFEQTGIISGSGALTKIGGGTLVLAGANTYGGGTRVDAGTLQIDADQRLGAPGAGLELNGGGLRTTASFTTERDTSLGTPKGRFDTDAGTTFTHAGAIDGGGGLTKQGAGVMVLSGTNTYTGDTTVSAGILEIGSDANLGDAGAKLILSGGTLRANTSLATARTINLGNDDGALHVGNARTLTHTGTLSGGGDLTKTGDGVLELGGNATYTGVTHVDQGTLRVAAGGRITRSLRAIIGGDLTVEDGGSVRIAATTTLTGGSITAASVGIGFSTPGSFTTPSLSGSGTVHGSVVNRGTVAADTVGITFTGEVSGSGGYEGTTEFAGTFRPGESPAQVSFETMILSGVLNLEIGGLTPGTQYDQLIGAPGMPSTAVLGGTLDIDLIGLGTGPAFSPSLGDAFDLIIADDITGAFASLDLPTLLGGQRFSAGVFDYGMGREVFRLFVVDAAADIPGPTTWLLLLWAGLLLHLRGRGAVRPRGVSRSGV